MVRILLLRFGTSWKKRWSGWQTLVAFCLGLTVASQASALGLGEIELDSALNERLAAEIELLDASGLQPSEIIVSLASSEDFERIGVERFFFLTDLKFRVTYGAGGGAKVSVSSSRPVSEPYLNFIVEVLWPNGRLLKEYTLLLDPPTFTQAAAPSVSAPTAAVVEQSAGRIERTPQSSQVGQVRVAPREARPSADPGGGEYRMTDRDDTLWTIASRTRATNSVSVQQNMLAILRLNPRAFIRDNINLLKAGYVLRLPSEAEALALTSAEANQQVAIQTDEWRAFARGEQPTRDTQAPQVAQTDTSGLQGQVDATRSADTGEAETVLSEGQLRIVAGRGDAASGGADATTTTEQVNAALEESDRLTREVDELTYQLDREQETAANQLAVRDTQLQLKDQEIADLQAQMQQIQQEMRDLAAENQNQNTPTTALLPWWQSPLVLGGGLGVLVLLLVVMMIRARRAREVQDAFYAEPVVEAEEPVVSPPAQSEEVDQGEQETVLKNFEADLPDEQTEREDQYEEEGEADETQYADAEADADSDIQGLQTSDVIGEADIYIAYGRYPQAIGLLLGVIDEQPERNDVRLKFIELYVETHDREAFNTHMDGLLEQCDDEDALLTARELEGRIGDNELAVDAPLEGVPSGDGAVAAGDHGETENSTIDGEFHLDLDKEETATEQDAVSLDGEDLDTVASDFEREKQDQEQDGTSADETPAGDFELEIDELDDADGEPQEDSGDDLGGDLGIDFDPSADAAEPDAPLATDGEPIAQNDTDTLNLDDIEFDSDMAEVAVAEDEEFASEVATAEEDEFEFEDDGDSANTKLDLARAYIDMGDEDGARDILKEVMTEGNTDQQQQAEKLLESF